MRTIAELDGVRAVAILAVLAFHGAEGRFFDGGYLGVDLFFVLSGFLITTLLLEEQARAGRVDLMRFYARRALRILPPLAAAVVLAVCLWRDGRLEVAIPAVLLFYANLVDWSDLGVLSHAWSLAIEEHFYLAWPVALLAAARGGWRRVAIVSAVLVVIACGLRIAMLQAGVDREFLYRFTFTRMDALAAGCLAAAWMRAHGAPLHGPAKAVPAAMLLAIFTVFLVAPDHYRMLAWGYTAFAVAAAVLLVSLVRAPANDAVRALLASPLMVYLGRRSYGLYLYHWPVFSAFDGLREPGVANFAFVSALRWTATVILSEISWRTIEAWSRRVKAQRFTISARLQTPS